MLKAPFPYFGGKSRIAHEVWDALGQPKHYIEPFFGSGAVLLARRGYAPLEHAETVCDADGQVANVWRAIKYQPGETAKWCDWPVNHADLMARRRTLIANEDRLLENLVKDDMWCDPKIAGYWIWASSCWVGSGMTRANAIVSVATSGTGVHAKGQIPRLTGGAGVHAKGQIPLLSSETVVNPSNGVYSWFEELSNRLRRVRVVCGDWSRVCGGEWQTNVGVCGIFFDPPYGEVAGREEALYSKDSLTVAKDVQQWALAHGEDPKMRIVLAGYYEEHEELLKHGWRVKRWSASGGYANRNKENVNRHKEALFMSPFCVGAEFIGID